MGKIVIAVYRPKPGKESALRELVRTHVSILRSESLVTDREPIVMMAEDGSFIEVFEWESVEAIESAHKNETVIEMWGRFAEACDYLPISKIEEASNIFSEFVPVDFGG